MWPYNTPRAPHEDTSGKDPVESIVGPMTCMGAKIAIASARARSCLFQAEDTWAHCTSEAMILEGKCELGINRRGWSWLLVMDPGARWIALRKRDVGS